jgi:soluble lytic murein transglycosylase
LYLVPVHRRWKGDRARLSRWFRSWAVLLLVLLVAPLATLLPPVQRLFFPLRFQDEILQAARATGVEPSLLAAVALNESGFRPEALSDQGAVGLMQLLPSTAEWAAAQAGHPWQGASSLRHPQTNLKTGAWYLGWLLKRFEGDRVLALAAYNVGQHTVDRWRGAGDRSLAIRELPYPETRCFVRRVMLARDRYRSLYPALAR